MLHALLALTGFLVALGVAERFFHLRRLARVPTRIHVNGSRGKSSVTRLIAAALREAGIPTLAKTTGSLPQFIFPDGRECPIERAGEPSIREQISAVRLAAQLKVQALVIECMAVHPFLQWVCEHQILRSSCGVMTAIRPDHLEVYGPTEADVVQALRATVPQRATFILGDRRFTSEFEAVASKRKTFLRLPDDSDPPISNNDLKSFLYIEHAENVALALAVCRFLQLDVVKSLEAMKRILPEPGSLQLLPATRGGVAATLVSGFAANDPISSRAIWEFSLEKFPDAPTRVVVMNCRADRVQRSRDLATAIADWRGVDVCVIVGQGGEVFEKRLRRYPYAPPCVNLCHKPLSTVVQEILTRSRPQGVVVGVGNIAGMGMDLVRWFQP